MTQDDARLIECMKLLDAKADPALCKQSYPELIAEIDATWDLHRRLYQAGRQGPTQTAVARRRQLVLAQVSPRASGSFALRSMRVALFAGVAGLLTAAVVGASAAGVGPAPKFEQIANVLEVLHGQEVSKAVHEAKDETPPGPERGKAVSLAACLAAHDRSTLPEGAQNAPGQNAPGQQDKEPKDCEKPNQGSSGLTSEEKQQQKEEKEKNEPPGLSGRTPPGQEKKELGGAAIETDETDESDDSDATEDTDEGEGRDNQADKCEPKPLFQNGHIPPGQANKQLRCEEAEDSGTSTEGSEKQKEKPETHPSNNGRPDVPSNR